jgi:anthranilate synthase component 1
MRSGAGIVADSDPDREYDETVNKAKAVFEAARLVEELS